MLTYQEFRPDPGSADAIRVMWSLIGVSHAATAEPIVSDGCAELIFNVGDPIEHLGDDGQLVVQPRALLVGPTARPTFVKPGRSVHIVGVRLQPWATSKVIGTPASELRDRVVPLDQISFQLREFSSRMMNEAGRQDRQLRLLALLGAKSGEGATPRLSTRPLIEAVTSAGEAPSVRSLARGCGRTVRSVERSFRHDVGLAPKTLLRISRVQCALRHASDHTNHTWTRIAAHAGYFDQAHFIREFRELVGVLPSQYRPDPQSLTTSFVDSRQRVGEPASTAWVD